MDVYGTEETVGRAVETFYLDRPGKPELIPWGLRPLDLELGGLGPRACGILAAATGVGKSSTMLAAMIASPVKVGCVSVEDGPDVIGTRILSMLSGLDSLRIRRKDLSDTELDLVNRKARENDLDHMFFTYPTAGSIGDVVTAVNALCERGCRMVWLDYLQKIRGHKEHRREEVSESFTLFQRAVAQHDVAGMAISQFRRLSDGERVPQIHHLKESGDLENEARVIILAHRVRDPESIDRVRYRVAKSTYGGEHIKFDMTRDKSGTLVEATTLDWGEGFD